ncbi:MAG: hypothetical protein Q8R11_00360 [bacterium]|nr:hypothetical protein [bacterium]
MENQINDGVQNTQQIGQNPVNQPEPIPEKPKVNYWVISTVIFAFLFLGTLGWYFLYASPQNTQKQINNSTIPELPPSGVIENSPSNIQTQQGSGKVAYRMSGTILEGGDVWTSNSDGSGKQKLTSSAHIGWLYSWSPDNSFILASTNEVSQNFVKTDYVAIDTQSGSETAIPVVRGMSGDGNSDFVWIGNKEIAYADENVIYKITIGGQRSEINRIPAEAQAIFYHLNKTASKIIYDTSAPGFSGDMINVFVYDLVSKQKNQISEGGNAYVLGWMGNNIAYQQGKGLWSSSSDGKTKRKLADLEEWYILGSAISQDGNKIFFTADNRGSGKPNQGKVFVYDSKQGKLSEIGNLDKDTFASNLSISRDAGFGGYTLSGIINAPSLTINFANNKSIKLCESSCYYPIWQN